MNKIISLDEAATWVESGSTLAIGGMTLYRRPLAFVYALLRRSVEEQQPRQLNLLSFTCSLESDLLVGAGMVSRVRCCYFGLEIFGLAPMFTYHANHGLIDVLEETEASLAFGLRARLADVGFMPGRGWIGTDLPRLRPDVKKIIDPYTGEELMAFPAIHPDLAVIHALRADYEGNAQLGRNQAIDIELAQAASRTVITAEEIVPELERADLVAPYVHAVVPAPGGAAPSSCHPLYTLDGRAILAYTEQVSDPESFASYLQQILDRSDHRAMPLE
jgi:glutaconate CoA-transferase subunit A